MKVNVSDMEDERKMKPYFHVRFKQFLLCGIEHPVAIEIVLGKERLHLCLCSPTVTKVALRVSMRMI